jgi:tRNA dimethylallyltransferase
MSTEKKTQTGDRGGPVIVVTGPTASGKTALSIALAQRFGGEIVNADSMQVYRSMDIGTAKPSLEERATVPHHLFDIVSPDADYNAGRYSEDARAVAAEIHGRGSTVVLTGGTGLYIRAFLEGLVGTGKVVRELRDRLEAEHALAERSGEPDLLHRRLLELDPETAAAIHPNDVRRTIRALEIIEQSGLSASQVRGEHSFRDRPYDSLHLAIDPGREVLAERIDSRCQQMIDEGLLREVRALRAAGYGSELRPMQAIGYRHINPVVDGHDTLANALVAMQGDTRRFARRQRTWLRGVDDVVWLPPDDPDAIFRTVDDFLEKHG